MGTPGQRAGQVLSDRYKLGEELGRGAYGQVFKGMDLASGDTVAIKQISLAGMSQDNLQGVVGEIDLLKTLNHKNIVKYIGSFKTRTHLYIILEYMENGALSAIIRPNRFGVLSEPLVAVYIAQVLQGLNYLHQQGVVHRDIKGANILTTKEGLVKLADFGVAAKLGELEARRDELQQHVVGTPYWMAPEVIEMTQVTSASDIWSVGCLIVELLTGSPPYYDLQPMSALFRIVQDDSPPLPAILSPLLVDFLSRCFQKDPRRRPGAEELLTHEWIQHNRRTLRSSWRRGQGMPLPGRGERPAPDHESVTSVVARMVATAEDESSSQDGSAVASTSAVFATPRASQGSGGHLRKSSSSTPSPSLPGPPMVPPGHRNLSPSPLRDGALATPSSPLTHHEIAVFLQPSPRQGYALSYGQSQGTPTQQSSNPRQQPTIELQPSGGLTGPLAAGAAAIPLPPMPLYPVMPASQQSSYQSSPHAGQQQQQHYEQQQSYVSEPYPGQQGSGVPMPPYMGGPGQGQAGPLTSLVAMLGAAPQQTGGQLAPWLYQADQLGTAFPPQQHSNRESGQAGSLGLQGQGPGPGELGEASLEAILGVPASRVLYELQRKVRELVRSMRPNRPNSLVPVEACKELSQLVAAQPEAKQLMMNETGALLLLELLDSEDPKYAEGAMELLMAITTDDQVTLETICLLGVVPAAARYALPGYPTGLRMRTANFLARFFYSGPSTLTHFIACQGLKTLVAMVADLPPAAVMAPGMAPLPYTTSAYTVPAVAYMTPLNGQAHQARLGEGPGLALSHIAIQCIYQFLDCYNILPHTYLVRLLAQQGLVPRLHSVVRQTINQLALREPPANGPSLGLGAGGVPPHATCPAAANAAPLPPWGSGGGAGLGPDVGWASQTIRGQNVRPSLELRSSMTMDSRTGKAVVMAMRSAAGSSASRTVDVNLLRAATAAAAAEEGMLAARPQAPVVLGTDEVHGLQDAAVNLLLLLSNADPLVKGYCCTKDALQQHLDCLDKLKPPSLVRAMRAMRWLTGEHSLLPSIKEAGALATLVPFLTKERTQGLGVEGVHVQLEALHALSNICKCNKVYLEAAATLGVTPHLCRMAADGVAALIADMQARQGQAATGSATGGAGAGGTDDKPTCDQTRNQEAQLRPLVRWSQLRGFVVPILVALVNASSSTRAKLWAANGPDLLLALLSEQDSVALGVPDALSVWLTEDRARMEAKLTQRASAMQIVGLYAQLAQSKDNPSTPPLLETLRALVNCSPKLAVTLTAQGLVPCLLEMIDIAAPILCVKILEIISCLYEHYPDPKTFLIQHNISEVLVRLLTSGGRGTDAVHGAAQRLLTAFQINLMF